MSEFITGLNSLLALFLIAALGYLIGAIKVKGIELGTAGVLLVAQSEQPLLIRLAAPTGKAAARLTESIAKAKTELAGQVNAAWLAGIPTQASTLHRLLV